MAREIITASLKAEVFNKYKNKCYVCGYSLKPVLRVHHIVPVSLGGADNLENLILLCGNCHTLTHFYSTNKYKDKNIESFLSQELADESIEKIKTLIERIHQAKDDVEKNGNVWTAIGKASQAAYEIDEAVASVASKNKFTIRQREHLTKALDLVLENIPETVFKKSSYRLLDKGRCISINLMNYLLFRSPAYGDLGEEPEYDCYIIFPSNIDRLQSAKYTRHKSSWHFKHFDCISLELSYQDLLIFDESDWDLFKQACEMANNARRTRSWTSNIRVTRKPV